MRTVCRQILAGEETVEERRDIRLSVLGKGAASGESRTIGKYLMSCFKCTFSTSVTLRAWSVRLIMQQGTSEMEDTRRLHGGRAQMSPQPGPCYPA